MQLRFTKMQGCGNDYIYISTFDQKIKEYADLVKRLSERHFGIGGDGVIFVCPSETADAQMRMFNEDGSEGKMCGNGIRCVAKFLYDEKIVSKDTVIIDTLSGKKEVKLQFEGKKVIGASVDMGKANFDPCQIPVLVDKNRVVGYPMNISGQNYAVTCVSIGNPHCVLFVEHPDSLDLPSIGPAFETNELFPERINTEFVKVWNKNHLQLRVWERGSGETLACGTGACAAVAAATENGYCSRGEPVVVSLRGGDLQILYDDEHILMQGPAVTVFQGVCEVEDY